MNILSTSVELTTREEAVRHIFGEQSYRVEEIGRSMSSGAVSLSEEPLYQVMVLLCMVFYFVWIYRYINKQGFSSFVGTASAITQGRQAGVHTGASRRRLGDGVLLWVLIMGLYVLFITKVLEVADGVSLSYISQFVGDSSIMQRIAQVGMAQWMALIAAGLILSMVWSNVILLLADFLSRSGTIYQSIFTLRSQMLLYSMIYLMPVILFCAFGAYDSLRFYFALILVIIFTMTYLIRSFLLFHSKKISILLWILYLCAVEIFPITLAWTFFTRS